MKRIPVSRLEREMLDTPTIDTLALDEMSTYSDAEFAADVRGDSKAETDDEFDTVELYDIQTLDDIVGAGWK